MYNSPEVKPWQSRKWVPAGLTSRSQLREETKEQSAAARTSWNSPTPVDDPADAERGIEAKLSAKNKLKTENADNVA